MFLALQRKRLLGFFSACEDDAKSSGLIRVSPSPSLSCVTITAYPETTESETGVCGCGSRWEVAPQPPGGAAPLALRLPLV